MFKTATKIVLVLALGATPVIMTPQRAQAQNNDEQRAYQAGFNNGQNDRNQNKPLNLKTGNWHGGNLAAYQRGYEDGYRRGNNGGAYGRYDHDRDHDRDRGYGNPGYVGGPAGYGYGNAGPYGNNDAMQRAYQAGFNNGQNDRRQNKPLNLKTGNWHGENLQAYERGYQDGYRGGRHDYHR